MTPSGSIATSGAAKVLIAKSMAMKLIAMPASVDEQRGARRGAADRSATSAPTSSISADSEARGEAELPGERAPPRPALTPRASAAELDRQHDQEHEREQRDGVDAVGQRGDVACARSRADSRCACQA